MAKRFSLSRLVPVLALVLVAAACSRAPQPPVAKKIPHELVAHGDVRVDDYYWLNERDNPEVLAYLEAENAYTDAMTRKLDGLRAALFEEMKGRIKEDDASAPYFEKGFWYYTRYVEGGEYPLNCRRQGAMDAPEQVMFDGNALALGHRYFALRGVEVSPDTRLAVCGIDTVGRRFYTLKVRDLATGAWLPDAIEGVTANVAWAMDNRTLFYARQDPVTLREFQVWRHVLGTPAADDVLVYQEDDDTFSVGVGRTKSDRYLLIESNQTLSSETRILEADDPTGTFRVFQPRQRDLEYHVEHQGDRFLVLTNLFATNFRLMDCPLDRTWLANWREVVPHRDDVLIEDFEVFTDWLVLAERRGGLTHLRVLPMDGGPDHELAFADPTWAVWSEANPEMDTDVLRFGYTSLTTPRTVYAYDMRTRAQTLLKRDEVLGGFDPENYVSEYIHVPGRDGVEVPVSLVYRKGTPRDGSAPLLLYGYGSYGYSSSASFHSTVLSLLDRGFVYAIAHVRGGQEMGRQWYEDGKLLKKKNTFTDFIDCGQALVDRGYTSRDRLFAMGGSAGGLLM
ncbi:MAG TPA: S9 family peptidase, partial [Candidatus Krumholzibacteria bacterium]|nr:S9 family peptidase [Candidatus Krumholzibacteria bacterium]